MEGQGSEGLISHHYLVITEVQILGHFNGQSTWLSIKKSWSVQKVFTKERFDNKYALAVTCDQEVLLPFLKKKTPDRRFSRSLQSA